MNVGGSVGIRAMQKKRKNRNGGGRMTVENQEQRKCDTCKHEKEPWTNGCADCFDYELWEEKDGKDK